MAKRLQLRRGTTSQHGSFTGAVGECTVDTDKDTLVVHDGSQAGGRPLLREDLNNLANDSVTYAHLQNVAANSILGNNTGSAADAIELTAAQVRTMINVADGAEVNVNPTISYVNGILTMSPGGDTATIPSATTSSKGLFTAVQATKLDGIATGAEVNVATNLGQTTGASSLTITSSTGNNVTVAEASSSIAGLMSTTHHDKLDGIATGAEVNVNPTVSYNVVSGNGTITMSPGGDTAIVDNVTTSQNGLMLATDKTKLDGIASSANNYSHPNHSGEVTSSGDGATTIADNVVDEANLKISNAGSNGQFLQKQSGNTGGLTWATVSTQAFPSGTLMLFQQTAAPTGWTKQTSHNDKALRVVSGSVSSGGGTAFSSVFGSSVSTSAHTLTTSQMPAHTHPFQLRNPQQYWNYSGTSGSNGSTNMINLTTQSAGGGGSHSHTMSMNLQFVDLIIASHD